MQLAAAYRGGSHSWGCHGYLSALAWSAESTCQPSRHQFPSSSIGNEFKHVKTFISFHYLLGMDIFLFLVPEGDTDFCEKEEPYNNNKKKVN